MKKILIMIVSLILVAGLIAGCGNTTQGPDTDKQGASQQPQESQQDATAGSQPDEEKGKFPITVTDTKGNELIIEKKPEAIISLTLGTDEMLLSMVDKSRIKAVSYLSLDEGLSNIVEDVKDIPEKIGADVEKIISLQPDMVFIADWADEKTVKQLRDADILVYACKIPSGIDEQKEMIREIAHVIGEDQNGEELINWMDEKLAVVEEKLRSLKDEDKLTAMTIDSFYSTYGTGTTFDDLANRGGVINLASKAGIDGWLQISKEKLIEMDPDVIFLPAWSYEGFDAKAFADQFIKDESLKDVKAVKNGMVFCLSEAHMTSVSQNIVLGVEDVAKAVYPELFD